MNYPLISEYIEAIKSAEDNFEELSYLRPVLGDDGLPVMTSGNFAVVFKMKDEETGKLYALKCFTKEQEGREEAYHQIADALKDVDSPYFVSLRYLEKELFVDSNQTDETEFPVLLMDWVEGKTLDKYLRENLDDKYALEMLAYQFSRLAMWLMPQPFAHGDLKPDNILVKDDGTLVLVDYDGMYVPAMKGQKARELGSPDFRHPSRTENDFDEHIDDFSLASILLSLKAIALQPSLLEEYGASDRLLFSEKDYRNLSESSALGALQSLMQDAELASLYSLYILALSQNNLSQVSFRLFNLSRPDKSQYKEENLSTEVTEEDLANAWVDNYGARYSVDWKRLLKGPSTKVIESMIVNNQNFKKEDMWVSDLVINKTTGKPAYWCSFDSFEDGVLLFLCKSIWENLSIVNQDTIWEVLSKGNYIIREAHDPETNKWLMNEYNCPIMMISPMSEKAHQSWGSNNIEHYYKELSDVTDYAIKEGTECICDSAFKECYSLKKLIIPSSVRKISESSFVGCVKLKSIIVDDNNKIYDSRKNCNAIIESNSNNLILGCSSTIIPENVTSIGDSAFFSCLDLETISIPDSVTKIGYAAFPGCDSLKSIIIPSSVNEIGNATFLNCKALTNIEILGSIKTIPYRTFYNCEALQYVTLPDSILEVGEEVFTGCNHLKQIVIPVGTKEKFEQLLPENKDILVEQYEEEEICLAYCSEDSQACEDKEYALWQPHSKILKKNGKLGVVIDDGTTKKQIIPFIYDTWFDYDGYETDIRENFFDNYQDYIGYFAIKNSDGTFTMHGYDKDGTLTTSFTCEKFNPDSYKLKGKWFLRYPADGVAYDDIRRMGYYYGQLGNDNCYFALCKGNKWSLIGSDLKKTYIDYVECDGYKEIGWAPKGYYAILIKGDKYQLCIGKKDGYPLILPNEYDHIQMRYRMTSDGCDVEGLCFVIKNGGKWAVCSNDLLQLSPFVFDNVGYMVNSNCINVTKQIGNREVELIYNLGGKDAWNVKDIRTFSKDEISAVKNAEVVPSKYGSSVCFYMQTGGQTYIPLYEKSSLTPGDIVDLKNALLITLCREGDEDIYRVME